MTLLEPASGTGLRAHLRLGSASLARHQLGLLAALGCERVIVIAAAIDSELLALQRDAAAMGLRMQTVPAAPGLLGQVSAQDELIGLADGLLAWPETARAWLDAGPAVLSQPAEPALARGFERLDATQAAAGAWRMPGRLVDRLADLPPDCDAFSTLQRIALQAGVPCRPLDAEAREPGRWTLLRSEAEAAALESTWIRLHSAIEGAGNPSLFLARGVVRRFGPALLHAGTGSRALGLAGVALILLALVTGWFHHAVAGLVMAALGWLALVTGVLVGRVSRETLRLPAPRVRRAVAYAWAVDAALVLLLGWAQEAEPANEPLAQRYFAAAMLVGLCRLVAAALPGRWPRWFEDRALIALAAAAALQVGGRDTGVAALATMVLAFGLGAFVRSGTANAGLTSNR